MSNDLNKSQNDVAGKPREIYKYWLGTIIPDNIYAGKLISESLINTKIKGKLIAIGGSRSTPASIERLEGLNSLLENHQDIELVQTVYGEWNRDDSYTKAYGLLQRYDNIRFIWAANDPMAIGGIEAAKKLNITLGEDLFVSGLNWSDEAFLAISKNEMVASVGGHFTLGGCTLMILYDHYNGIDFANSEGLRLKLNLFKTINKNNIENDSVFIDPESWKLIDFKKYTKKHAQMDNYFFSIDNFLKAINLK